MGISGKKHTGRTESGSSKHVKETGSVGSPSTVADAPTTSTTANAGSLCAATLTATSLLPALQPAGSIPRWRRGVHRHSATSRSRWMS